MVLMIEPIDNCISHLKKDKDYSEIIFMKYFSISV